MDPDHWALFGMKAQETRLEMPYWIRPGVALIGECSDLTDRNRFAES